MNVETRGTGVLLPELRLALDAHAAGYESVCTHAHADHVPWDAPRCFASPETADLLAVRAPELRVTPLSWGEPTRVGDATVTLRPSGHILGAALVHVEAPDGETLLYTADTRTTPARTCAPAEFVPADVLVVESTFGLPILRWPDVDDVADRAAAFARETLAAGEVPVFLAYALGKGQEVLALLNERGVDAIAHGAAWRMCEVYARHGVAFPRTRSYDAEAGVKDAALVVPPSFRTHPMVARLKARVAYVSGWARLARSRVQHDADELVQLSDHADFAGLCSIVEQVAPKRVYTNHGYADVFAHLLRKQGVDAQPLTVGHREEEAVDA